MKKWICTKLTNMLSKMFKIETADKLNKKKFTKTWNNNMSLSDDAKISEFIGNNEYT